MRYSRKNKELFSTLKDKVILLIGGTGSFGQKFAEIILSEAKPRAIRVYSRDELKQWEMAQTFHRDPRLRFLLGDVRDPSRLDRAMDGVHIVVHAAALKHVVACEYNPFEAVKTNIIGAQNIIESAINHGVEKVIGISTDKAVNPINLYGATKLCMEKVFTAGNAYVGEKKTAISCVRYGNVVGSRGSVIPLFLSQKKTGTVTVTDTSMTRFWITLEQGVRFVVQGIRDMSGGEIFIPKIPSVNILDLVKIIAPGCKITVIGVRPGEKIHEVLLTEDEARHAVETEDMYVVLPEYSWLTAAKFPNSKALPVNFRYSSDNNPIKHTNEIQKFIEKEYNPHAL